MIRRWIVNALLTDEERRAISPSAEEARRWADRRFNAMHRRAQRAESQVVRLMRELARMQAESTS